MQTVLGGRLLFDFKNRDNSISKFYRIVKLKDDEKIGERVNYMSYKASKTKNVQDTRNTSQRLLILTDYKENNKYYIVNKAHLKDCVKSYKNDGSFVPIVHFERGTNAMKLDAFF